MKLNSDEIQWSCKDDNLSGCIISEVKACVGADKTVTESRSKERPLEAVASFISRLMACGTKSKAKFIPLFIAESSLRCFKASEQFIVPQILGETVLT